AGAGRRVVGERDPERAALAGDMYVDITWSGKTGYVIGYLVNTPGDWRSLAGPAVWTCAP
ncbi:hypothetical protein AB0C69_34000, partial [Actinomadura sp. NPDC048032]|uniref:hypothetical protein n=1 Tax=Actinomadura sp. NPDC048032 TaxID=3155747 RepID=UPI0033E0C10D